MLLGWILIFYLAIATTWCNIRETKLSVMCDEENRWGVNSKITQQSDKNFNGHTTWQGDNSLALPDMTYLIDTCTQNTPRLPWRHYFGSWNRNPAEIYPLIPPDTVADNGQLRFQSEICDLWFAIWQLFTFQIPRTLSTGCLRTVCSHVPVLTENQRFF